MTRTYPVKGTPVHLETLQLNASETRASERGSCWVLALVVLGLVPTWGCSASGSGGSSVAVGGSSGQAQGGFGGGVGGGPGGLGGQGGFGNTGGSGPIGQDPTCSQTAGGKSYVGCDFWPTVVPNNVWNIFDLNGRTSLYAGAFTVLQSTCLRIAYTNTAPEPMQRTMCAAKNVARAQYLGGSLLALAKNMVSIGLGQFEAYSLGGKAVLATSKALVHSVNRPNVGESLLQSLTLQTAKPMFARLVGRYLGAVKEQVPDLAWQQPSREQRGCWVGACNSKLGKRRDG